MKIIQHIALNCRDIKSQERFYSKHFGFTRSRVFNKGTPDEFVMIRLGSACIELFTAKAGSTPQKGGEQNVGFKHLAFEVEDIESSVAALVKDGIIPGNIIDCSAVVEGLRVCFFDDPEGNKIELMHGYKDQSP